MAGVLIKRRQTEEGHEMMEAMITSAKEHHGC